MMFILTEENSTQGEEESSEDEPPPKSVSSNGQNGPKKVKKFDSIRGLFILLDAAGSFKQRNDAIAAAVPYTNGHRYVKVSRTGDDWYLYYRDT